MPSSGKHDLLRIRRPRLRLDSPNIPPLNPESKQCLRNLAAYHAPPPVFQFPKRRTSAVLVALFVGRAGDLNVLVSQRASTLRTFAGDTVLPGGRWEEGDETIEDTARREAFEEVGLPIDKVRAPLLCVLEPYLAGNHVLVFPVVVLLLDNTVQPLLNHAEVSSLFAHPLYGFLTLDRPSKSTSRYFIPPFNDPSLSPILDPSLAPEPTTDSGREPHQTDPHRVKSVHYSLIANFNTPSPSDPYYAYMDVPWSGDPDRRFRMHRFLTGREAGGTYPIYGLTASVLIRTASIGFAQPPLFPLRAPGEPSTNERIARVFAANDRFRDDCRAEGIDPDDVIRRARSVVDREKKESLRARDKARL